MLAIEAEPMAKAKGRPKKKERSERTTVINLKGSEEYAAWLDAQQERTRLSKTMIVRIALELWAKTEKTNAPPKE